MSITRFLHQFKFLRQFAKVVGRRINIKQKFYNGFIFLNAVEHSWAWTGKLRYESFDQDLQNYIHQASADRDYFIDIGSNIGVMTISTLLKNEKIKAVAVEPNLTAVRLLKKTLAYNGLAGRSKIINAVVGDQDGFVKFDSTGSVTGHVSSSGAEIPSVKLSGLLNEYSNYKVLVKIDVEGYEAMFIDELQETNNLGNFKFIIEIHPLDFNGAGNPQKVFETLTRLNASITDLQGNEVTAI